MSLHWSERQMTDGRGSAGDSERRDHCRREFEAGTEVVVDGEDHEKGPDGLGVTEGG